MVHDFSKSGPYHVHFEVPAPAVPDAVTLNSGFIPTDLSLGGSATLAMNRNGDYTFSGHMHDSGALGIDFLITFVVMTPSAIAITVQHGGSCGGTFTSGSRDNDWSESGNNKMISDNWAEVTQGTLLWTAHANDTLTHEIEAALQDALQQALQAAGKAAVQGLISLVS